MSAETQIPTPPAPATPGESSSTDLAVARCCKAWEVTYKARLGDDEDDDISAQIEADEAYRKAMPLLSSFDNIRDFIACVAHAITIGAIVGEQASRLLYAAQVALSGVPRQPAARKSSV